jgi:hypothetical protein
MRITEAVADLAADYPQYSRSKIKTCLKIEMEKFAPDNPRLLPLAVNSCREVIDNGALEAVPRRPWSDATANEVQARVGKSDLWLAANPIGSMATKGKTGLRPEEIEKIVAAEKEAQKLAEAWRKS